MSRSDSGLTDIAGGTVWRYDFGLPAPVGLAAGTYYLAVMNDTSTASWYWLLGTGGDGIDWRRAADTDAWSTANGDLAFQVSGTPVPIPGALYLFGAAVAGLATIGRCRT